jgi:hypothetical protein
MTDPACGSQLPIDPTVHLREYQYISQFSTDSVCGLNIFIAGVQGDPDSMAVTVTMTNVLGTAIFTNQSATRVATGQYQVILTSAQTATPGYYSLTWAFNIATVAQSTTTYIQVGAENPDYDTLPGPMQDIIQMTWGRFADTFDSPGGGPHLQTYFQTNFSMGRLAQLLNLAIGRLNIVAQPQQTYTLTTTGAFPYAQWGPLLEKALYVETLKHLIRSYTEQPNIDGVTVTMAERRDYTDRWTNVLQSEEADLRSMLDVFKIASMGLGRSKVLVAGGAYGRQGVSRMPGQAAARGNMFASRWF